ncbi:hypothetical protein FALBO_7414 [Fusarium albosuccineum]|uniref:Uncharacterized protein n=1 Tax=Fusarium albosuccineum TaxID=1237068 RepID=A0A8H4LD10_9HYPO|nr:hypothetical protein FALBO_7414 [Fusarium albosuccineum]KAF5013594.1 hypothetical protein FDECE_399 [Fusarium decemcellulare]
MLRRDGGEVMRGGSAGWLGFGEEDAAAGGDVAGEEVADITAVIDMPHRTSQATVVRSGAGGRATAEGWDRCGTRAGPQQDDGQRIRRETRVPAPRWRRTRLVDEGDVCAGDSDV